MTDATTQTGTDEAAHLLRLFLAARKTGGSYDLDIIAAQVKTVLAALVDTQERAQRAEAGRRRAARTAGRLEYHCDQQRARADAAEKRIAEQQAEIDRLWYFLDANDRLHDVITGRPDHYIVNGDHSGCDCGTDWTPPPVRVEWSARTDNLSLPVLPEASARMWAERPGYHLQRRLVGPWRDADPAPEADDRQREGT